MHEPPLRWQTWETEIQIDYYVLSDQSSDIAIIMKTVKELPKH